MNGSAGILSSYAIDLLQALIALAAVCLLAVVVLTMAARRGFGTGPRGGPLKLLQRIPLEGRRTLYLVGAGSRVFLIGVSEGGGPVLLAELDAATVPEEPETQQPGEFWQRWLRRSLDRKEDRAPAGSDKGSKEKD